MTVFLNKKELNIEIGLKIRELRIEKKLSIQEFSDKLDMEYSNLIRIEKGRTNPTVSTLYNICQVLDVKLTDVVDIE